jgi:hypothetical protein
MGYTTYFTGRLVTTNPVTDEQLEYLSKFIKSRRMKRDVKILCEMDKGRNGFPGMTLETNTPEEVYGNDGEYYVDDAVPESIIDYNKPPGQGNGKKGLCQPGLWCQWEVKRDFDIPTTICLEWDGGEKFYNYVEWLNYLIKHFFSKWNIVFNGSIEWKGEDGSDRGVIVVEDNVVKIGTAKISYAFDDEDDDEI